MRLFLPLLATLILGGCFTSVVPGDAGMSDGSISLDTTPAPDTAPRPDTVRPRPDTDLEPDVDPPPPPPPPLLCEEPLDVSRLTACTRRGAECYRECTERDDNPARCLSDCDENGPDCANCITTSIVACGTETLGCEPEWLELACCLEAACDASLYNLFDEPSTFRCFGTNCGEAADRWSSCASDLNDCARGVEMTCNVRL